VLFNALEKYHSRPGFALLLGNILQYTKFKHESFKFPPGLVASLYLIRQQGQGHILDDWGINIGLHASKILPYFIELLENPEQLPELLTKTDMRPPPRSVCNCACVTITSFRREPQSRSVVTRRCLGINLGHGKA
jgi:hypothetical protein